MSFGQTGDHINSVIELAGRTLEGARKVWGEEEEMTQRIEKLRSTLEMVKGEIIDTNSPLNHIHKSRKRELGSYIKSCDQVLTILEAMLKKMNAPDEEKSKHKKVWRVRFGDRHLQDLPAIKLQLSVHNSVLIIALKLASLRSAGRWEKELGKQHGDLRGLRESIDWVVAKMLAKPGENPIVTSYAQHDPTFWKKVGNELSKEGISTSILHKYKHLIKCYIRELGDRGIFNDGSEGLVPASKPESQAVPDPPQPPPSDQPQEDEPVEECAPAPTEDSTPPAEDPNPPEEESPAVEDLAPPAEEPPSAAEDTPPPTEVTPPAPAPATVEEAVDEEFTPDSHPNVQADSELQAPAPEPDKPPWSPDEENDAADDEDSETDSDDTRSITGKQFAESIIKSHSPPSRIIQGQWWGPFSHHYFGQPGKIPDPASQVGYATPAISTWNDGKLVQASTTVSWTQQQRYARLAELEKRVQEQELQLQQRKQVKEARALERALEEARAKAREEFEEAQEAAKLADAAETLVNGGDNPAAAGRGGENTESAVVATSDPSPPAAAVECSGKPLIHFKDALGRRFSFPFETCRTWDNLTDFISYAFAQIDVLNGEVTAGRYDLFGPDEELILPRLWEDVVEPGWSVSMVLWNHPGLAGGEAEKKDNEGKKEEEPAVEAKEKESKRRRRREKGREREKEKDREKDRKDEKSRKRRDSRPTVSSQLQSPPPPPTTTGLLRGLFGFKPSTSSSSSSYRK